VYVVFRELADLEEKSQFVEFYELQERCELGAEFRALLDAEFHDELGAEIYELG
jgi:hypothetical protein